MGVLKPSLLVEGSAATLKRLASAQLRAARGLLAGTTSDLGRAPRATDGTLALIECQEDAGEPHLLARIDCSLRTAGTIFLDNCMMDEGGPGVRLGRQDPYDEGLHLGELTSENDG
ncbi:hypothetical protein ACRAWG_37725 [Methylobacterium sp. P31]